MAVKQTLAVEALKQAAGEILGNSLCEISNGWIALVQTEAGKKLRCVTCLFAVRVIY